MLINRIICIFLGHKFYHLKKPNIEMTYCLRCFKTKGKKQNEQE